jgi:hypothetical protein
MRMAVRRIDVPDSHAAPRRIAAERLKESGLS